MKRTGFGTVFADCLKRYGAIPAVGAALTAVNGIVFFLYNLPPEPFLYASILELLVICAVFFVILQREARKAEQRDYLMASILSQWNSLPDPASLEEADYCFMLRRLGERTEELTAAYAEDKQETVDYFTAWVHQVKTPISVMKLRLEGQDSEESRALSAELFRLEQYVDMVLQYVRLGSESNDLVIREYSLDELIRDSVRRYASLFVYRKLSLDYEDTDAAVVTDRKWFCTILEQLISNAIKYTPEGTVTIRVEGRSLLVSDTGIGISPEDLPRIFEKGFTGNNGRTDRKSSGLGLYLAKKAADKLSLRLSAESVPGEGSTFRIDFGN